MTGFCRVVHIPCIAAALVLSSASVRVWTLPPVTLLRVPDAGLQPQLVTDAKGTAHVIYFRGDAAHGDVFYTRLNLNVDLNGLNKPNNRTPFAPAIQVNSRQGSAVATGTMRGGHIALGRNGRVHVAWPGSTLVRPKDSDRGVVLYTRLTDTGTRFEPERNVVHDGSGLDGGTVAADGTGQVFVIWHALAPGEKNESGRRVWVARSEDDGRTFAAETPASPAAIGACGCCGVGAMAGPGKELFVLFRSAADNTHRDTYLLSSRDPGTPYAATKLQGWNIASCPMSTYALTRTPTGVLAAWETAGQIYWTRIDPATGKPGAVVGAPGSARNRKHPAIAANARGETLLVWTEGAGWNKGGGLAWQLFDASGVPLGDFGRQTGIAAWSLAGASARPDDGFVILY